MKPRPGQRLTLKIDRLSIGGRGVGRHEGLVVFVSDVVPGELAQIELTKVKKNFAEARLISVIEESPDRVVPTCRYAGACGGCSWQHLRYATQLEAKRDLVLEALRKFSGFDFSEPGLVEATVPSPTEFRYRNRIQVHFEADKAGFHRRSSHHLVAIDDCLIADERLVDLLRSTLQSAGRNKNGTRVELFLSEEGQPAVRGADFESDETAFSQVNSAQNVNLVAHVLEALKEAIPDDNDQLIADLYAGNGNFTLPLARTFSKAEIASAELNARSVRLARERFQREFPGRPARLEEADVADFVRREPRLREAVVLLDPPRTGCSPEVAAALSEAEPKVLVYVSCHPVTLARDLKAFSNKRYRIASVRPFDMFPQTDHVETVVVMHRLDESRPV